MAMQGIPPIQAGRTGALRQGPRAGGPPPPSPSAEGDSVELSTEARQRAGAAVPDAVTAAVADLKGSQVSMAADFRAIGDYFRDHGGREALDAFMGATFTDAQLRAFPPPAEGAREDPPTPSTGPPGTSSSV